ncbi:MAG: hypothetical protein WCC04_07345 [Terriglobales bacterium]
MNDRDPYTSGPAGAVQFWSAHVDALDRHLSAKTWALGAVTVALIAYPIARIVVPAIIHGIVPDAVRAVLSLIAR